VTINTKCEEKSWMEEALLCASRENDKNPSITHIYFALELFCEFIFKNSRRSLSRMGILYSQQFIFGSLYIDFSSVLQI